MADFHHSPNSLLDTKTITSILADMGLTEESLVELMYRTGTVLVGKTVQQCLNKDTTPVDSLDFWAWNPFESNVLSRFKELLGPLGYTDEHDGLEDGWFDVLTDRLNQETPVSVMMQVGYFSNDKHKSLIRIVFSHLPLSEIDGIKRFIYSASGGLHLSAPAVAPVAPVAPSIAVDFCLKFGNAGKAVEQPDVNPFDEEAKRDLFGVVQRPPLNSTFPFASPIVNSRLPMFDSPSTLSEADRRAMESAFGGTRHIRSTDGFAGVRSEVRPGSRFDSPFTL
jgi:hypothetical protein